MFIYSHVKCENFRNMVNQYIFGYITAIYSLNFHHIPSTLGMKKHLHIIFSNLNNLLFNNLNSFKNVFKRSRNCHKCYIFNLCVYEVRVSISVTTFSDFRNVQHGHFKYIMTFGLNISKVFELRYN